MIGKFFDVVTDSRVTVGIQLNRRLVASLGRIDQKFLPLLAVPKSIMKTNRFRGVVRDVCCPPGVYRQRLETTAHRVDSCGVPELFRLCPKSVAECRPGLVRVSEVQITGLVDDQRTECTGTSAMATVDYLDVPGPVSLARCHARQKGN